MGLSVFLGQKHRSHEPVSETANSCTSCKMSHKSCNHTVACLSDSPGGALECTEFQIFSYRFHKQNYSLHVSAYNSLNISETKIPYHILNKCVSCY